MKSFICIAESEVRDLKVGENLLFRAFAVQILKKNGVVMPELPEVEVVRGGLESILESQPIISKIEITRPNLRTPIPLKELKTLEGQALLAVERRAKYLIFRTGEGSILSHLGMTGTWRVAPRGEEKNHDHIYIHFVGGLRLAYRDPRRFGVFEFIPKGETHPSLRGLGPEPLEKNFNSDYLAQALSRKDLPIKAAIMDQKIVVGVGNIYACEALFMAGINPLKPSRKVSLEKLDDLVKEIKKVLKRSIKLGGSSISDFAKADGKNGYFQNTFKVYGRSSEPCVACEQHLVSRVVSGRNTFWCRRCQK